MKTGILCALHPELEGLQVASGKCAGCNREFHRKEQATRKEAVIRHYGGRCAKCFVRDIDMLTIDHTDNDGAAHRASIGIGSGALYNWLMVKGFPPGFQVLCANHNLKKHLTWQRSLQRR